MTVDPKKSVYTVLWELSRILVSERWDNQAHLLTYVGVNSVLVAN